MWGRPEIEGHMLYQQYVIKLHSIEKVLQALETLSAIS